MQFILWILLGAVAGWIASKIMGTDAQMGAMMNIIVGIIGAFIGGFVTQLLLGTDTSGLSIGGLVTAVLGAVILLAIVKAVSGRNRRSV